MNDNKNWFVTLIINIKINSIPYVAKFLFFIGIVFITYVFSDWITARLLSILTYVSGICIDAFFINKKTFTDNPNLEVFTFIHMIIVWTGTGALLLLLITTALKENFFSLSIIPYIKYGVNLFVIYVTMTPLLEAILNSKNNQMTNNREESR